MSGILHCRRGEWEITFEAEGQRLICRHGVSGATIAGSLAFTSGNETWDVCPSRDGCPERLALCAPDDNVQGYVVFSSAGDELEIAGLHRTAQSYSGRLRFTAAATLGEHTFACRTAAPAGAVRVVQMGSGAADSLLNDSLFDIEADIALCFSGLSVRIAGRDEGVFGVEIEAAPERAAHAAMKIRVVRDYYRSRYVPYYAPRDRDRAPRAPTGWMSWNVYFDQAGAEENLAEARIAAEHLQPFGLEIWSIESWQANSDTLPVRDFHNLNLRSHETQFPDGMAALADEIRALGFRPGIWTAPFGTGNEAFYREHREWFLHDETGTPFSNWCGRYLLDPSQPEVREYIREMHRVMANGWGYEFFKIDGMSGRTHGYSAHFYERPEVRRAFREECPNPFELCVEALREGIGPDRLFLACQGHYTGPEAATADAARIGGDIVSPNQPSTWPNILSQGRATLNQLFVHNILWYNDPDTLLVGDFHGLEQARVTTTVVALPGQLMFAGDKLGELSAERMRLLQQALPVCEIRPLDLYPIFELCPIWDLKIRRPFASWDVVALFNWEDEDADMRVSFAELGLPAAGRYVIREFWETATAGVAEEGFHVRVPARGTRLVAVHPYLDRPQFVATDRHITQGGVSLPDLQWNADSATLLGVSTCVGGHETRLWFYAPPAYNVVTVLADAPVAVASEGGDADGFFSFTLRPGESGPVHWEIQYECNAG